MNKMSNKDCQNILETMSISDIMDMNNNQENILSSDDLSKIISKLSKVKRKQEQKEAKKREEEEKKKRERKAHIKKVTTMDLPLHWENQFDNDIRTQGLYVDSISDGLIYSLSNLSKVDIEYISSITKEDYKTVIQTLKGSIFQNPETWGECFYKGWETSDEYLSGNLRKKLKAATVANEEYDGYFSEKNPHLQRGHEKLRINRIFLTSHHDISLLLENLWLI